MKLLVSDIDGTLYWYNNQNNPGCSEKCREAIKLWLEAGNKFALATARTHLVADRSLNDLGLRVDYLGGNGAENVYSDGTLDLHYLPISIFLETGKWIDENGYDATVKICLNKQFISYRNDRYPFNFPERMRFNLKRSVLYNTVEINEDSLGVNMSLLCPEEKTKEIEVKLQERFKGRCQVIAIDKDNIDFIPLGTSKSQAIIDLAKHYGISMDDVITVGDEANDICMFEITKNSYCMSHSRDAVKQYANYVVDLFEQVIYQNLDKN